MIKMTDIHVPALMDGNRIVVPSLILGKDVEYKTDGRQHLTAAAYQAFNPSTLAGLRHAYFGKNHDGNFVAPEYRESVLSSRGGGERTSTFLRDGRESIEQPGRVFYDDTHSLWIAEGGKVTPVELPPEGWTLEYDKPTGFPSRTSKNRTDAKKIFGDDTSYFYATRNGLRAVLRDFDLNGDGPFYVSASYGPDDRHSYFGVRPCRRSEQGAEHLATPVYVIGQAGYTGLVRQLNDLPTLDELRDAYRTQRAEDMRECLLALKNMLDDVHRKSPE